MKDAENKSTCIKLKVKLKINLNFTILWLFVLDCWIHQCLLCQWAFWSEPSHKANDIEDKKCKYFILLRILI